MTERTYWHSPMVDKVSTQAQDPETYEGVTPETDRLQVDPAEANLIASLCDDGQHMPVIDLDLPCRLIPSRTPGHHHLYIDTPIPWDVFVPLLDALVAAGLVEEGYRNASVARGATFVRWKAPPPEQPPAVCPGPLACMWPSPLPRAVADPCSVCPSQGPF